MTSWDFESLVLFQEASMHIVTIQWLMLMILQQSQCHLLVFIHACYPGQSPAIVRGVQETKSMLSFPSTRIGVVPIFIPLIFRGLQWKSADSGVKCNGFGSWLHHSLALWPWAIQDCRKYPKTLVAINKTGAMALAGIWNWKTDKTVHMKCWHGG